MRQVVGEGEGDVATGGQANVGRTDGGDTAVQVVGIGVCPGRCSCHQGIAAAHGGAQLADETILAGFLRVASFPEATGGRIRVVGVDHPALVRLEVIEEEVLGWGRRHRGTRRGRRTPATRRFNPHIINRRFQQTLTGQVGGANQQVH